jgi:peptidoglycan/xylan/chitin deacetylase (PgdA/CDA1 family)
VSHARYLLGHSVAVGRTFGLTAERFDRILREYEALLHRHRVSATFPTTTVTLLRHPAIMRRLAQSGIELAVHGLRHVDHSALDLESQSEQMARARWLFQERGFSVEGFRCPYLRWNEHTRDAARGAGFSYVSNETFFWGPFARDAVRRLYRVSGAPRTSSLPFTADGILEIPPTVPDDCLLAERLHLPADTIAGMWGQMLKDICAKGELLVLQLHPASFRRCARALSTLLHEAGADGRIWITTLAEVASWWRRKRDFEAHAVPADGALEVTVRAPSAAVFTLGDLSARRHHRVIELRGGATVRVPGTVRPFVAVSPGTPDRELLPLRERGLVCERTDEPGRYAARLGIEHLRTLSVDECVALVESCEKPLLQMRNWPQGVRSALCVTGDVDCVTLWDYVWRLVRR